MNLLYLFQRHRWGKKGTIATCSEVLELVRLATHISDNNFSIRDVHYRLLPMKIYMKLFEEVYDLYDYKKEVGDCDDRADKIIVDTKTYYLVHCNPDEKALAVGYVSYWQPKAKAPHAGVLGICEGPKVFLLEPVGLKIVNIKTDVDRFIQGWF